MCRCISNGTRSVAYYFKIRAFWGSPGFHQQRAAPSLLPQDTRRGIVPRLTICARTYRASAFKIPSVSRTTSGLVCLSFPVFLTVPIGRKSFPSSDTENSIWVGG